MAWDLRRDERFRHHPICRCYSVDVRTCDDCKLFLIQSFLFFVLYHPHKVWVIKSFINFGKATHSPFYLDVTQCHRIDIVFSLSRSRRATVNGTSTGLMNHNPTNMNIWDMVKEKKNKKQKTKIDEKIIQRKGGLKLNLLPRRCHLIALTRIITPHSALPSSNIIVYLYKSVFVICSMSLHL